MKQTAKILLSGTLSLLLAVSMAGCSAGTQTEETASVYEEASEAVESETPASTPEPAESAEASTQAEETSEVMTDLKKVDMSAWNYDSDGDFYWQTGLPYCSTPADATYETMGFFVPGPYFQAEDNGDGTFTCTLDETAEVGGYTAATAPMVIPINTPGYSAMRAPTDAASSCGYGNTSDYTGAGYILVFAGARGRDAGAPAGVTDFKAAIRYTRYNADLLPGDPSRFFSFGMSGGGAQSALLGTSGDNDLYTPYLKAIGAVEGESDAVLGAMCWCPITNLDVADEAYEWNLGSARTDLDEETQKLSDEMSAAFAAYINDLQLQDEEGNVLTLDQSEDGSWHSGSYYDYVKKVIEESLNNFLADTEFPYDASSASFGRGGPGGGMGGNFGQFGDFGNFDGPGPDGEEKEFRGPDGQVPDGNGPDGEGFRGPGRGGPGEGGGTRNGQAGDAAGGDNAGGYEAIDDINRNGATAGVQLSGTYDSVQDYIDALNADKQWVNYDPETNTATITSVEDFVEAMKPPTKDVGAFDALDRSQGENILFGYGDGEGAHFDSIEGSLVSDTEYAEAFAEDLAKTDELGNSVEYRMNMYNPMYYLCGYYDGAGSSVVAQYFRIRTGINQGDTALSTEIDLALALEAFGCDVDFATVWGLGHTEAERTGTSTENFIGWVNDCLA